MTKPYPVFLSFIFVIAGCSLDSDTVIVPDVEDEFYLELFEEFDNGERSMDWKLRTIESVGCEGASINFSFQREAGQVLSLSINQVIAPSDCDPAEAPARAVVELGTLPNGKYPVSVALRETLSQDGSLSVYDQFYEISLESGSGIVPLRNRLYRIPEHTVWGFIAPNGAEEWEAAAEAFLTELNELTQEQELTDGHYGYFEAEEQGQQLTFPEEVGGAGVVNFQRSISPGKKEAAIALISDFRSNHEDLALAIFNTFGEEW